MLALMAVENIAETGEAGLSSPAVGQVVHLGKLSCQCQNSKSPPGGGSTHLDPRRHLAGASQAGCHMRML